MNGVLPSAGTASRLRDSRSAARDREARNVESVRRRLTFAPNGLTEAEVNRRCGWPTGAGTYLRILQERGEAYRDPDGVWHLGPAQEGAQNDACNRGATTRRPTVVGGPREWLPSLDESAPVRVETVVPPTPRPAPRPTPTRTPTRVSDPGPPPPADPGPTKRRRPRKVDPEAERQQVFVFVRSAVRPVARIVPRGPGRPRKGELSMADQLVALLPIRGEGLSVDDLAQMTGLDQRQVAQTLARARRAKIAHSSGTKNHARWTRRREIR